MLYVVVMTIGNVFGPFDSEELAINWIKSQTPSDRWKVRPLHNPA